MADSTGEHIWTPSPRPTYRHRVSERYKQPQVNSENYLLPCLFLFAVRFRFRAFGRSSSTGCPGFAPVRKANRQRHNVWTSALPLQKLQQHKGVGGTQPEGTPTLLDSPARSGIHRRYSTPHHLRSCLEAVLTTPPNASQLLRKKSQRLESCTLQPLQ